MSSLLPLHWLHWTRWRGCLYFPQVAACSCHYLQALPFARTKMIEHAQVPTLVVRANVSSGRRTHSKTVRRSSISAAPRACTTLCTQLPCNLVSCGSTL